MGKYFGTDGFRGEAGEALTAEHAYEIGRLLGWHYKKSDKRVRVVIGKDTRLSSYMLEYAIAAGLTATGADAYMLHVTTTPSVSYSCSVDDFDCGIMISASHNPYFDNGIKIVNAKGEKLDDATISKIESYLDRRKGETNSVQEIPFARDNMIGKIVDYSAGRNRYIGYLISLSSRSFKHLRIGLDASNGGAWMIAKSVFDALGAKTYVINDTPDGLNINHRCGSTHPEGLCKLVTDKCLDMGFAFDGDADRCIAVDEKGELVNGDHILYILAKYLKEQFSLTTNTVVTTVMSNLGLYRALEEAGINHTQTAVGDKYVYECMSENSHSLGGEQSGHIIMSKYATTGDGILTAIKITEAVIEAKSTLSKLKSPVVMLPQVTKNLPVKSKRAVMENSVVTKEVEAVKSLLEGRGRILLRESGTEPLIRIMVEAESYEECENYAHRVAKIIKNEGLTNEP